MIPISRIARNLFFIFIPSHRLLSQNPGYQNLIRMIRAEHAYPSVSERFFASNYLLLLSSAIYIYIRLALRLSYYPKATSRIIISTKPKLNATVPQLECFPSDISGISSSTTT